MWINHNYPRLLKFPCTTSCFLEGSMAWHSLQTNKNNLKSLRQGPGDFPVLVLLSWWWPPCFLALKASFTTIPLSFLLETSRFRTGTAVICCHLWESPYSWAVTILLALLLHAWILLWYKSLLSELSLELVLALLQLLLLLVLLLLEDINESLLLMLLVLLVPRELSSATIVAGCKGKACGKSRPLKKRWSAGEVLHGSWKGESGVKHPNSKSESWSWFGVIGKENISPELDLFLRFSMEDFNYTNFSFVWEFGCMSKLVYLYLYQGSKLMILIVW